MAQGIRIRTRMTARDPGEANRVSSPLELLVDLTFVVAIAQIAGQLADSAIEGRLLHDGIGPYLMVFFAVWWAWMNFTWFASAYDTDDLFYRLLTVLQMAGVLVLAAGVPSAFAHGDYFGITIGYLVMRIGLVAQWIRAGVEHPAGGATSFRYAAGVAIVQLGWVSRLLLPDQLGVPSFLVLMVLDLAVPLWAERSGMTAWHPHHIAERYGLFTIIVLGESVSAATVAVQGAFTHAGLTTDLLLVALAGLVLLVALWWLYFLEPAGHGLERRRQRAFFWGYGHYFVFASLAAVGAALEVAVEAGVKTLPFPDLAVGYLLAVPVALYLVLLAVLRAPLVERLVVHPAALAGAALLVLLAPLLAPAVGVPGVTVAIAIVVAALVGVTMAGRRAARG